VEYRAIKGDNLRILDNFHFNIKKGDKVALIGSNGAGKTTVMKLITGFNKTAKRYC